jgi:hypothetical protein
MAQYLSNTNWSDFVGFANPAQLYARLSRLLLVMASIVLVALPFTQQLWTWDRFLHGGQDFETSILLIVTSLCLVLVLVRGCKQGVTQLLTLLSRLLRSVLHLRIASPARFSVICNDRILGLPVTVYTAPLQI